MHDHSDIKHAVEPILDGLGLALYDIEMSGTGRARVLRVTIQKSGGGPDARAVGIDELTDATRCLDPIVEPLVQGAFSLEVSSPGLDRTLRTPEHFMGAIGETISLKFRDTDGVAQRVQAQLLRADAANLSMLQDSGATIDLAYEAVSAAHTVFVWGPAPKPGKAPTRKPATRTPSTSNGKSSQSKSGPALSSQLQSDDRAPAATPESRTKETTQS